MTSASRQLLEQALRLDESERATLAGRLIESINPPPESGAEAAWNRVIERRVAELDSGEAKTVPWSEVRADLFDGLD